MSLRKSRALEDWLKETQDDKHTQQDVRASQQLQVVGCVLLIIVIVIVRTQQLAAEGTYRILSQLWHTVTVPCLGSRCAPHRPAQAHEQVTVQAMVRRRVV